MYLGNFIKNLNKKYHKTFFSGVAFNSKEVKKNNIFFAIQGTKFDGNKYIFDAINKGAKIIISKKDIKIKDTNIIFLKNANPRKLLAEISFKLIKKKPRNLIAVTGTNGKSSVVNFYYQILNLNKKTDALYHLEQAETIIKSTDFWDVYINDFSIPVKLKKEIKIAV